jgi:Sec-independent protein translocase protein TatA
MTFHPILAFIDTPILVGLAVLAVVLFGADQLPKLARSAGQAKKEFLMGQLEADEAAAKARAEMEARVQAQSAQPAPSAPPADDKGAPSA